MKGYKHLTLGRRYLIQELLKMGKPYSFIAKEVECHRSTVYREIQRNSREICRYRARIAQEEAMLRRPFPDDSKRKIKGILKEIIIEKLTTAHWSPQQISIRLKLEARKTISHEAIYRYVYEDRECGGMLYKELRCHGRRRKRGLIRKSRLWRKIPSRKFIELRPKEADERTEFGHWERDLVLGKRKEKQSLLTIVDRKSRYTLIEKVTDQTSATVAQATFNVFELNSNLPLKSITNDNGVEFGKFRKLEEALEVPIYFTHPYCAWERGTNENMNGLLREFFKKGKPIAPVTHQQIQEAADLLNSRPRKMLGYKTPKEVLYNKNEKLIESDYYYRKKLKERELRRTV